jgi:nucleoid DNA-binding protein
MKRALPLTGWGGGLLLRPSRLWKQNMPMDINGGIPVEKQGANMTKRNLVVRISLETGLIQQDVYAVIQKTLDYIVEALARGESIEFRNFGVFEVRQRKQRIGRNPNKPTDVVTIPERKVVKFKPGKIMKQLITGT